MADRDFTTAISKIKVPMLILDQKWHRLFALGGKPEDVKELEKLIDELEVKMSALEEDMKDPDIAGDYIRLNEKCTEYEQLKALSAEYSDEWLELSEE